MKIRNITKRFILTLLSAVMIITSAFGGFGLANKAYAADANVQKYEEQIASLEETQKELQNKINANKNEAGRAAENKANLDALIYTIESKIKACEELLLQLESGIDSAEDEIAECEAEIEKLSEKVTQRLRMMQEDGGSSYLEILFGARSIVDFLSRIEHVKAMIEYDRNLSAEYSAKKDELAEKKDDLEKSVKLQNETMATLEKDKADAKRLSAEADKYISALEADNKQYQNELKKAQAAEAELDRKLTEYLKNLQNQNSSQVVADGDYLWPLPKGKGFITCKFGGSDPNNKPHYALDIAIGAGTPIYATNDGTVLIAGWHDSYGYYILIDHGNGMASLYAHCSALLVSAGQTVSRGQTVGKVGTTGFSKGNHLHFEIRKNGQRTNPLNYMAPQAPENIL